jgi:uncharacterized membrane protein (UPF0127 family)
MIRTVRALNSTRGHVLAERVEVASSAWSRFWGLMGRLHLRPDHGLLISPCTSIHMFFMRFPIDVVFLTRDDVVVKVVHGIQSWRMATGGGGKKALELPVGAAAGSGLETGDQLEFVDIG